MQTALGQAVDCHQGPAAPEVAAAYHRARELCQKGGETPQLFRVLRGLVSFYVGRGELQTARELSEELRTLAQHLQDPVSLQGAHFALGSTLLYLGEFTLSRTQWEMPSPSTPLRSTTRTRPVRWDLGVFGHAQAPHVLWLWAIRTRP